MTERTWRDELADAQAGIQRAHDHRQAVFRAAQNEGLTLRAIASVTGVSFNTVKRIIDGDGSSPGRDPEYLLGQPPRTLVQANAEIISKAEALGTPIRRPVDDR